MDKNAAADPWLRGPDLPTNCKVLSVGHGGASLWVTAVKIVVELEDGTTAEFFKKVGDAFAPSITPSRKKAGPCSNYLLLAN